MSLERLRTESSAYDCRGKQVGAAETGLLSGMMGIIPVGPRLTPLGGCHPDCLYSEAARSQLRLLLVEVSVLT